MRYFGIKCPDSTGENLGCIWWIAEDYYQAWMAFFQHMPSRALMAEAIQAYEAIGYRCVELEVHEKAAKAAGGEE